ncbi:MAG: hypothetical protein U1A25_01010 [Candidatus Sungbacteria bacterium]|nr:hypothetical protein [bacterium]MDZ4260219.1 hypothetical protein [Candidatus Sungbacteria bacterium]
MSGKKVLFEMPEDIWDELKDLSGISNDESLLIYLVAEGRRIFQALQRDSRILELTKGGDVYEISFSIARDMMSLNDFIKDVELGKVEKSSP